MEDQLDYEIQQRNNEELFKASIKAVRPDIWALMNIVDETKVNSFIVYKIILALDNLAKDTKYGQVVVEVENNVVRFIRGVHAMKVNEDIIKDARKELGYIEESDSNLT